MVLLPRFPEDQGAQMHVGGTVSDVAQGKTEKKGVGVVLNIKKAPDVHPGIGT